MKDLMTTNLTTCSPNDTVERAAEAMLEANFSTIPVVDDQGNLLGIVTESDFIGHELEVPHSLCSMRQLFGQTFNRENIENIYQQSKEILLHQVMIKDPCTVSPGAELTQAVQLMFSEKVKRIPVVEGSKLVGMITVRDLLRALVNAKAKEKT